MLLFARSGLAATNSASSSSWSDVSNAVFSATAGDTVLIPSGNSTWTGDLVLSKSINLIGSGSNTTIIAYSNAQILYVSGVASNSGFRLSGITFSNTAAALVLPPYYPIRVDGPLLNFRIDHCWFHRGNSPLYLNGRTEGVIDHDTFWNCEQSILMVGDQTNAWTRGFSTGTTNCVVIEDNVFFADATWYGPSASRNQDIYHQGGAKSAVRRNIWNHNGFTGTDAFYDSHGLWASGQAQPLCEWYLNTINATNNSIQWFDIGDSRGGSALWWSNTFVVRPVLAQQYALKLWEEGAKGYQGSWPSPQQVSNTFLWGNTFNGALITDARIINDDTNATIIQLNRDYWMEAPNSTNGLPAGVYNGYTPLVYPHPRVTAEDLLHANVMTGGTVLRNAVLQ